MPDVAILSDEIYGQMTYDGLPHVSLLSYPEIRDRADPARRLVEDLCHDRLAHGLFGLAEAALRQGAQARRQRLVLRQRRRRNMPASRRSTGPQDSVAAMVAEFDKRRKIVVEELNKLPGVSCITPKGAFYAFPNIAKTGFKAKTLASALLEEAGVAIIGGPDFGIHGEGYLRLSYANSAENIRKAIARMASSWPASTTSRPRSRDRAGRSASRRRNHRASGLSDRTPGSVR